MKKYKLKSKQFVTQFWHNHKIKIQDEYYKENCDKIFTYNDKIISEVYGFEKINSYIDDGTSWIIPIDCLQEINPITFKLI